MNSITYRIFKSRGFLWAKRIAASAIGIAIILAVCALLYTFWMPLFLIAGLLFAIWVFKLLGLFVLDTMTEWIDGPQ